MPMLLHNEGAEELLQAIKEANQTTFTPTNGFEVLCWQNNLVLDETSVLADVTEADFSGYARVTLGNSYFGTPAFASGVARMNGTYAAQFLHNGGGLSNNVYGEALIRNGKIVASISHAAILMDSSGDVINRQIDLGFSPTDPPPGSSLPADIIAWDTFTQVGTVNLDTHTAQLGTWVSLIGTLEASGGQVAGPNADEGLIIYYIAGLSTTQNITLRVLTSASDDDMGTGVIAGIAFRVTDATRYCFARINGTNGNAEIGHFDAGVENVDLSTGIMVGPSTEYTLILQFNSTQAFLTVVTPAGGTANATASVGGSFSFNGTEVNHGIYAYQDSTSNILQATFFNFRAISPF